MRIRHSLLILFVIIVTALPGIAGAQDDYSADAVIALAASSPPFVGSLDTYPGWTAAAYDTRNAYGIWHVTFWDADGNELGWAVVSPERARIYASEVYFGADDGLRAQAEPILRDFIYTHPDVLALVPNPWDYEMWFDYDPWSEWWWVYVNMGTNSIIPLVRFEGGARSLTNPSLVGISFEGVVSHEEWENAARASAVALAFDQAEVANALRPHPGWTSDAAPTGDGSDGGWWVGFYAGETLIAEATVNIYAEQVTWWQVSG